MKNKILKMFALAAMLTVGGCETFDLDQLENPSRLEENQSDPKYVFNYVQLTLADFVDSANSFTQRVTRQMAMTGGNTYNNAFAPVNFDNNWTTGYLILNAIKHMEPKAQQNNYNYILGASKVIRCYVLMTMVDMYGDIPYSEALQGNANLTPKFDNSAAVYAGIYDELGQAITYLNSGNPSEAIDLYYGDDKGLGSANRWVALANTLKLKMLNNARLVGNIGSYNVSSEISTILASDIIDSTVEDFAFKYGTERVTPNSRHPLYNDHYELGAGAYIGNYMMWAVSKEKGQLVTPSSQAAPVDPREAFYFFKQAAVTSQGTNSQNLPCKSLARPQHYEFAEYNSYYTSSVKAPYCTSDYPDWNNVYLGRDHGDNSGIPQDDELRTVVGIYPAGGEFGSPVQVNSNTNFGTMGELGRGIMPMVLTSYVYFIRAEIKQTMGIGAESARSLLESAIRESIKKTTTFIPMPADARAVLEPPFPSPAFSTKVDAYVNFVLTKYDEATTANKLQIIEKEYYIASWGNGIEPYNTYRRTGYPSNFQPTIEEASGDFFYTALYPGASVNNNPNSPPNTRTRKVFWDVANLDLH